MISPTGKRPAGQNAHRQLSTRYELLDHHLVVVLPGQCHCRIELLGRLDHRKPHRRPLL